MKLAVAVGASSLTMKYVDNKGTFPRLLLNSELSKPGFSIRWVDCCVRWPLQAPVICFNILTKPVTRPR